MGNTPPPLAAMALAELHDKDRALGVDPFEVVPAPPPAPVLQPPSFWIERPDWEAEARERAEREAAEQQQERARILEQELARLEAPEAPPKPTPPTRRGWRKQAAA